VKEIGRDGIRRVLVLNLYPQYSVATTGSSLSRLNRCMSDAPFQIYSITSWFDNPLYIEALVEKIRKGLEGFEDGSPVHVLFSAHSLPERFILEGDPYADQIKGTIEMVAKKIEISWSLSYQSRSGPVKWLEPSTDATIEELAKRGVRNLLVVPISFVSDHIETLYEIDILYKTLALERGIRLQRAESLNTSPLFISALKDIVFRGLKEAGWEE
jgi:ferrochelatase